MSKLQNYNGLVVDRTCNVRASCTGAGRNRSHSVEDRDLALVNHLN